jgi:hypothetical protein
MKNKNKIREDEVTKGSDGTGDTPSATDTSSTTAGKSLPASATSTTPNPKGVIYVKSKDIKKPEIDKTIKKAREYKLDVKIVENKINQTPMKLEYLSEIKDAETGEVSKPFTIADKKYQMVRAMTPDRQKVMGVYCMDEVDGEGNNIIHDVKHFEENIAKKAIQETGVVEPDGPEMATLMGLEEKEAPSFAGYKHFIVNQKTGKARKFKSIEELAKAQMGEDEKYMGIREFKKFVDESLFGASSRGMGTVNEVTPTGQETDEEMNAKAQKLMKMIGKRIPSTIIDTIKTNKVAQREVIAAFAELIGVPRNGLSQLITGIKDIAKTNQQKQATSTTEPAPVTERKIIKVKDIK